MLAPCSSLCSRLWVVVLQSVAQNYDTANGLGSSFHELIHGVDCPFHTSYLDQAAYVDRDAPLYHPQSICIWEQDTGDPLRRHYTQARSMTLKPKP
jgi:Cu2+-containing amine oxidase